MKSETDDALWRLMWIIFATCAVAYAGTVYLKSALSDDTKPIVIATDKIEGNMHRITGLIPVASECHSVSVAVQEHAEHALHLEFKTWQEPYRDCKRGAAYRRFHTTTFGPSVGLAFTASLDGKPIDLRLLRIHSSQ